MTDDIEQCEGCGEEATRTDSEGVPLCLRCFNDLVADSKAAEISDKCTGGSDE